jgi:Protein of unknown function (DUF2950)
VERAAAQVTAVSAIELAVERAAAQVTAASAIELAVESVLAIAKAAAEPIALGVVIFRAAGAEIETPSVGDQEVPGDTTGRAHDRAAAAVHLAWDLEVAAVGGADRPRRLCKGGNDGSTAMKSIYPNSMLRRLLCSMGTVACAFLTVPLGAQQSSTKAPSLGAASKTFDTPRQAADALINAAEKFDERALAEIFGSHGEDIYLTGEYPQDRQRALDFAAQAREKESVSVDPKTGNRAFLLVGDDWPFPVPIVKVGEKWSFDAKAGRQELLHRRIGNNELDAIDVCRGYVEAQYEYALQKREGYEVNQYAQRIISTPGKQDGLAWQNPDGSWGGPVGEKIARAIEQGYSTGAEPYHGYFFKILKGQGSAAPLGEMDYVVKGVMIGGFALVAAPAEYGVTGVKTFIVSQDGVVYEKDFGLSSLSEFIKMERFNPDQSWNPVPEEDE